MNEEVLENLIESVNEIKKILITKDDRLMTTKEISEEFGIGNRTVCEMFKDSKLPVQNYTKPSKVLRSEFLKYLTVRHPNLNKNN